MIYWKTTIPKDLEEIGNLELNRFFWREKSSKYCEIDNNTQPTNPCV